MLRKSFFPTVCHKSLTSARNAAYVSASHTYQRRSEIYLSSETLEMYLDLFLSALMALLVILSPAEWIMYLASVLRVKLSADVKSKRNPPLPPVLVRFTGAASEAAANFSTNTFLLQPW